jgi:hypothetical protein
MEIWIILGIPLAWIIGKKVILPFWAGRIIGKKMAHM